jgi:hypothetical protein
MEELSVSDFEVTSGDGAYVTVTGSGSPDGATVTVEVRMADGSIGQASGTVSNGTFNIPVPVTAAPPASGTASITVTDPDHFGELEGSGHKNFKI